MQQGKKTKRKGKNKDSRAGETARPAGKSSNLNLFHLEGLDDVPFLDVLIFLNGDAALPPRDSIPRGPT